MFTKLLTNDNIGDIFTLTITWIGGEYMKKIERNVELKAARVRAGKTQQECADVLGITRIMYAQKERGLNGFSLDQAGVLSAFLRIPKQDFFKIFLANNVYTNDNNGGVTA
jgi:DNA-binding XRE family transcriptional regulator